jgi:hypothetical protein
MGALRPKPLPARKRAVREMAVFQRQQQKRIDENEECSRGSHRRIAADLGLPEAQQSFFVAEVEFDLLCGDENYVTKRSNARSFPHCLGLGAPHNQMRLRGLDIHSGKGTRGGAFGPSQYTH